MEENRNRPDQQIKDDQRELDKNETLDSPGANVVDYGRSEEKTMEQDNQSSNRGAESDMEQDMGK